MEIAIMEKFKVALLVCFLAVFSNPGNAGEWKSSELVIFISMDGMRYDYPDKGEFPAFERMENDGLRVGQMYPVFPANTFPSHVSMATGTYPEQHGIIDNTFYDKSRKKVFDKAKAFDWIEAEPLWISAVSQGKRSAVYYWLGSEGQWRMQNATYFKTPFESLRNEQPKVDQIIEWLDMPLEKRPHLIMSYWEGADTAGHDWGPESEQVLRAIKKQDALLHQLIDALDKREAWPYVTLVVASDHGMTGQVKNIDLAALTKKGKFAGYFQKSSSLAHLNLKKGFDRDEVYRFLKQQEHFDIYYPEKMPSKFSSNHENHSGDLVLVAHKGYRFSASGFFDSFDVLPKQKGMHGYSPYVDEDMRTIFLAMGRGVKSNSKLEKISSIDIAPSISRLLGIKPPLDVHKEAKIFLPN